MPLAKQVVSISFEQGVDGKTDPKQLVPGKLPVLENGVFTSRKRIQKRNGYEALSRAGTLANYTDPAWASSARALMALDDEMLLVQQGDCGSYSDSGSTWARRVGGLVTGIDLERHAVVRDARTQTSPDVAAHSSGLLLYAYDDVVSGLNYALRDPATGTTFSSGNAFGYGGKHRPRVVCLGGTFFLFFVEGGVLKFWKGAALTFAAGSATTVATLGVSLAYDAVAIGDRIHVVYSGATTLGARTVLEDGTVSAETAITGTATAITAFPVDSSVTVVWYDGADVKMHARSLDLSTEVHATAVVETVADVSSVAGAAWTTGAFWVLYTIAGTAAAHDVVKYMRVSSWAVSEGGTIRSVSLASKPWASGVSLRVWLAHDSPLQKSYFLHNGTVVLARAGYGVGAGRTATSMLPSAATRSDGRREVPVLITDQMRAEAGGFATSTGVMGISTSEVDAARSYARTVAAESLHIGGGFLQLYSGGTLGACEHGFHLYPEGLSVPNPGGVNSYQYVAVYEWVDARGYRHRSAPSPAVTQAMTDAIDGTHTVTVTLPCLALTAKGTDVDIAVYRTIANGTVFYYVASVSNDRTSDTVSFTDDATDATLLGNETLYTTGGVIENIAPNACGAMWVGQSRLFLVDSEDRSQIWFSKQVVPGTPVEFSDLLTLKVMPLTGPVVAGCELDGKQILFRERAISFVVGDGPDNTGNGSFSQEQVIPTAIGCKNPRSVVVTPTGVIFQANEGFHLLDRSLNVSYIGADVEPDNGQTVTSGVVVPGVHQVRWTLANGTVLVFDYLANQWSRFTGINAIDACVWKGRYVIAKSDGNVWRETPGVFTDPGGAFVKLKAVTGWLNVSGLQGFHRVYRVLVVGEYKSAHNLLVKLAYAKPQDAGGGFEAGFDHAVTIPGAAPYQFGVSCASQKVEAVRVSIEDVSTGTAGESFSLSAIALEVGVKSGAARLPPARNYG